MKANTKKLKKYLSLVKETLSGFSEDKIMKKSAALAYYTIFSLAPLLLIIMWTVSFFYGEDATAGRIFEELNDVIGPTAAKQVQDIIQKISLSEKSGIAIIIGIGTLIVGSTTVFVEIQDSINTIWGVRAKPQKGLRKMIIDRVLSFSIVIGLGFLLIVSLIVSTIIELLSNYLLSIFPDTIAIVFTLINFGITFIVIAILFAVIFKFLPDAEIKWKHVRGGAIFTAILFIIGKYLISLYMQFTAPESAYGAAGSIIIILLWIYYTSAILYFGAEFTKVYTKWTCGEILPSRYAVRVIQTEIEHDVYENTKEIKYSQSSKDSDLPP
jgi:membrane protein